MCKVQDMGSIHLKMFANRDLILQDTRYVPKLKQTLLSINVVECLKYYTKIEHGLIYISHDILIIGKGTTIC